SSHLSILLSNVASIVCCSSYNRCTFSISLPEAAIYLFISSIFYSNFVLSSSFIFDSFFSCCDNFSFYSFLVDVYFVFFYLYFFSLDLRFWSWLFFCFFIVILRWDCF